MIKAHALHKDSPPRGAAFAGLQSIATNGMVLSILSIITMATRFLLVTVLARSMGTQGYGDYSYALGVSIVALGLAMFGTNPLMVQRLGVDRANRSRFVGTVLVVRTLTSVAAASMVVLWAWLNAANASTLLLITIFSLGLIARAIAELFNGTLIGLERSGALAQLSFARLSIELATIAVLAFLSAPIWLFAGAYVAIWMLQLALAKNAFGPVQIDLDHVKNEARTLLMRGGPLALSAFCIVWLLQSPLITSQTEITNGRDWGHLALVTQMVVVLRTLPMALAAAAIPVVARAASRDDGKDEAFFLSLSLAVWVLCGMAILLVPEYGGDVIALVFGDGYADASALLSASVWLLLPASLLVPIEGQALVRGKIRSFSATMVVCAASTAIFSFQMNIGTEPRTPIWIAACGVGSAAIAGIAVVTWKSGFSWTTPLIYVLSFLSLLMSFGLMATGTAAVWVCATLFIGSGCLQAWYLVIPLLRKRQIGA